MLQENTLRVNRPATEAANKETGVASHQHWLVPNSPARRRAF
jgi:hypothetical protein